MKPAFKKAETKDLGQTIGQESSGLIKGQPKDTKDRSRRRNLNAGNVSSQRFYRSPPPVPRSTYIRPTERHTILTHYADDSWSDDEVVHRHSRPRAKTGTQRDTTPTRDYDLVIEQRLLEKNDARQDLELFRQEQEIERLERDLMRMRDSKKDRYSREEEGGYEDEISERLRRLERIETKVRKEEAERRSEERLKLQKFEEAKLSAKRQKEAKSALREQTCKELQKKMEEKERRERIRKELGDEEARRRLEEYERVDQEKKIRLAAVEEYKLAEERRLLEEEKRKRQLEKEVRVAIEGELGCTLEQAKAILKNITTAKSQRHMRGRTRAFSATDHDLPSKDEADMEAP